MRLAILVRNELVKLFAKKRTYLGFAAFLLAQNAIILLFRFTNGPRGSMLRRLESNGFFGQDYISALTVATFMLFPLAYILLPLYLALVGGDLVAKEDEDGTLRMILCRPISRLRLLLAKWLSGLIFATSLVFGLAGFGLLFARLWFPWGGLFVMVPGEMFEVFDPGLGLKRFLLAHVVMTVKAATIMGLALMFSCFKVKPAAATVLALSFVFVSFVIQNIPYFHDLRHWFLTYHLNCWQNLFLSPVPWLAIVQSVAVLLGFNLTFAAIASSAFHWRDIK